ncbi:hypothetical protein F4778DRAFT_789342 [Xylariomycetidae sp. FL2044]|nr:hypothetical protein F4778DRAFT_789342 [Xylariomycetidae sp. FL2044]
MSDSNYPEAKPRGPRLYHKKSRTGCLRCKQRRVKCDEVRPSCGSCTRHVVDCVYPVQAAQAAQGKMSASTRPGRRSAMMPLRVSSASASSSVTATTGPAERRLSPRGQSPAGNNTRAATAATAATSSPHSSTFYPSPGSSHHQSPPDERPSAAAAAAATADVDIDLPDGNWRRLWELRLLHNQQTDMTESFPTPRTPELNRIWKWDVPRMAIHMAQRHNRCSLLYVMLGHSALNLWTRSADERERAELIRLQRTYLAMCSRSQRRDIEELNGGGPRSGSISSSGGAGAAGAAVISPADAADDDYAEYTCWTGLKLLMHSLALVQTLSVDPWEPPTQWLHMGRGAGQIFEMARSRLPDASSKIKEFINTPPILRDPLDHIFSDHSPLDWLLEAPPPPPGTTTTTTTGDDGVEDRELEDPAVADAYHKALGYTCSVQRAMRRGEPEYAVIRRLGAFAVWVPSDFARLVEERRPRALVVLAHFMALWIPYADMWVIGGAGERQIRAIHRCLLLAGSGSGSGSGWAGKLDGLFARFRPPAAPGVKVVVGGGGRG